MRKPSYYVNMSKGKGGIVSFWVDISGHRGFDLVDKLPANLPHGVNTYTVILIYCVARRLTMAPVSIFQSTRSSSGRTVYKKHGVPNVEKLVKLFFEQQRFML